MIRCIFILISFSVTLNASTWYVRPGVYNSFITPSPGSPIATPGIYGSQNGTSYANAWNGIQSIAWGSVLNGDTVYVCGTHIYSISNNNYTVIQATVPVLSSGVTIRFDYAPDPGTLFGGAFDRTATGTWSGPDANGVYSISNSFSSPYSLYWEVDGTNIIRLNQTNSSTWLGGKGTWYQSGVTNFIKTSYGGAPTNNIALNAGGWSFEIPTTVSNVTFIGGRFIGGSIAIDVPVYNSGLVATNASANHISFVRCRMVDCNASQVSVSGIVGLQPGNDYWTFDSCEVANGPSGIYSGMGFQSGTNQTRGVVNLIVTNCYIHDLDTINYPAVDGHAIGVQEINGCIFTHNTTERTCTAIALFSFGGGMSNNIVSYNSVKDVHWHIASGSTGGEGIWLSGSTLKCPGNRIYGNVILNTGLPGTGAYDTWVGGGISSSIPNALDILNNTLVNAPLGIYIAVNSFPANATVENNIIVGSSNSMIHISGTAGGTIVSDYNLIYTNIPCASVFSIGVTHDQHSVFSDPLFVSTASTNATNFGIQGLSPAAKAGINVGISSDFSGMPFWTTPSIGAFQSPTLLGLTLSSDGMTPSGLALQWVLSGLAQAAPGQNNFYSCEVATNGTTFYQSNVTANSFWNITVANNATWKFRLQSIINGVAQGDFSTTNSVYGDSKPENVSVSSTSVSSILLAFKNLSTYETGFLAEESTNSSFSPSTFYNVGPTPQVPFSTTWPHTFTFLPNTQYYYRLYATNYAYTVGGSSGAQWANQIGGVNNDAILSSASDSSGNVFICGYYSSTITFGGVSLVNHGLEDMFMAKLNASGSLLWVTNFGGTGNDLAEGIAVDPAGNVVVAGSFQNTVNFGITNWTSNGGSDLVLLKLDGATGAIMWAKNVGGSGDDFGHCVAVAPTTSDIIVAGEFSHGIFIGSTFLSSTAGSQDSLVARFGTIGNFKWATNFVCAANDAVRSVKCDANGNVLFDGYFQGTIDFGAGPQHATVGSPFTDLYVAKLTSTGGYGWSDVFGGSGADVANGIALDSVGNPYITGSFGIGDINFGGSTLPNQGSDENVYLVSLSGTTGSHIWSKGFTHTANAEQTGLSVAVDTLTNVIMSGGFKNTSEFGSGNLVSAGDFDVFVSAFTSSGTGLWSTNFGGTGADFGYAAVTSGTNILLAGDTSGGSFGFTNITSAGQLDGFTMHYVLPQAGSPGVLVNAGITLPSATVSISPNQTPQPASLFVSRTTDTANQIINSWNSGGGSINNWILQEAIGSPTTWTTVAAPVDDPVNGMSFTTNGLTPGVVYYWRVYGTNGAGASTILTNRVDMPIPGAATGGNWYIDIAALTNGSNLSGTNWANAWPNISSASWSKVSAGTASPQTIWVAKGAYNEYGVMMTPGSGALVTMHAATNAAQTGLATFLSLTPYRNRFVINGALSDTFTVPTGAYPALFSITNNCGFKIASQNTAIARGIYSPTDSTSNQVFWCMIGPVGIWHTGLGESDQGGIGFINTTSGGTEMAYCFISDIFGTAITMNGGQEVYGTTRIHHNIIERAHCNYVVTGYGSDIYNNYMLDVAQFQIGHPDGGQPAAAWTRFANNYVKDVPNGRLFYPEMFRTNVDPNIMVVGNLFWFDGQAPAEAVDFTTEPLAYNGGTVAWPSMTFSNILIANNTMVNLGTSMNARRNDVTNLFVKSFWFLNNVVSGDGGGTSLINIGAPQDTTGFISPTYDATQVIVDNNIIENGLIRYNTNILTVAGLPFTHNTVANPGYANKGDFHMTNSVAGTNLTTWLTQCPFLAIDMDSVPRATWQVGAFETVVTTANTNDAALVAWYRGTDLSSGIHDDSFNHAQGFSYDVYHFPTNYTGPTAAVPYAWAYHSFHSANPDFFGEGQYAGVPYTNNIDGMTNATWAWWGKCFASPDGTLGSVQNSVWFSSGAENDNEIVGSFYIGRHGTANTVAIIQTNNSTTHPIVISYPDTTTDGSTSWNHYALTFDGTKWIGYYNGAPFQTNTPPVVSRIRVGGTWMSISSWPHNGTPQWNTPGSQLPVGQYRLDDGYPNAGFCNGAMADARIYSRALTGPQVLALFTNVVVINPQITNQPVSVSVGTNTTPTFTVGASGASLTYQWSKSGIAISGATTSSYTTPATVCADSGATFSCLVTNTSGSAQSSAATLTITNCAPPGVDIVITQQPSNQSVPQGSNATFSVTATGGTTLHYAWSFGGSSVGTDSSTYTRSNCQLADSQKFATVIVSDASGTLQSNPAKLIVVPFTGKIGRVTNFKATNVTTVPP